MKFKLYLRAFSSDHRSILHFTVSSDLNDKKQGDRLPALYLYGSSLSIAQEIDRKWNVYKSISGKLRVGEWMDIEVKQRRHFGAVR